MRTNAQGDLGMNDGDDDKDKDRELRLKGLAYLRLGLQKKKGGRSSSASFAWYIRSTVQYVSWARPFHDLCRRDQVFLVVVVFKFEFVVLRSGSL